jgi:hypothetical protein
MLANSVQLAPPSTAGPRWETRGDAVAGVVERHPAVLNLKPHIGHDAIGRMVMSIAC